MGPDRLPEQGRSTEENPPSISPTNERGSERFSWRLFPWKSITTIFGLGLGGAALSYIGLDRFFHGTHDSAQELMLAKTIVVPFVTTVGVAAGILITHCINPFKGELRRIQNP